MFKNVEVNYAGFGRARRIMKTTHDEQILNTSLNLCLEFGNGQAARKIVKFCQDNFTEIDGEFSETSTKGGRSSWYKFSPCRKFDFFPIKELRVTLSFCFCKEDN